MPSDMAAERPRFLVSCEHASNRIPAPLRGLGLPPAILASHRGFDVGALPVARLLARRLAVPLHAGRWSRLLVDLNRSAAHPGVVARQVDGRPVPGNELDAAARQQRLARYWQPYRDAVAAAAAGRAARGTCVHWSVHSFVERLGGVERRNDVGLLYDPARPRERALALQLRQHLLAAGWSVRCNFPYFGDTDGVTTALRRQLPAARYLGLEIELNQRVVRTAVGQRRLGAALVAAVLATFTRS